MTALTAPEITAAAAGPAGGAAAPPARAGLPRRAWHVFWTLRDPISGRLRWTLMVLSAVTPLAAWVILSGTGAIDPVFLPSPAAVARAGSELWSSGLLLHDLSATMTRIGIGFALVVLISVPIGVGMGTFPSLRALFEPMIGLLRYMPAPAFIPLLIIWLGLGETSKITLLLIGTVFFNTLMSADAAALVPRELIDASYTLGASRWTVVRKVVLPHSLPGLIDAMRVNIAATFNLVVVAELIAAQSGLGYRITRAQRFLQTDQIFFVLIVIGLIGVSIDLAFRATRNLVAPWAR
ncbi:MAG: NitT/TauT family transport system permease protein [Actinomycetota bacterium]|jgi:NitT/TauT family transport system permease protein